MGSNPAGGAYIWRLILDIPPYIAIIEIVIKHFSAILAPLINSRYGRGEKIARSPDHPGGVLHVHMPFSIINNTLPKPIELDSNKCYSIFRC